MAKAGEPTGPSRPTVKRLFALSGNKCAFPDCRSPLVDPTGGSIIGEVCHIKGEKPGAARYDATQTNQERHSFGNLILLCGMHHKIIDDNPQEHPVENLRKWKASHQVQHQGTPIDKKTEKQFVKHITQNAIHEGATITSQGQIGEQTGGVITNIYQHLVAPAASQADTSFGSDAWVTRNRPRAGRAPQFSTNLPAPDYSRFVGRKKELNSLRRLLLPNSGTGIAVLHGIGGIGKTALALETAYGYLRGQDSRPVTERFDAVIWISAKASVLTPEGRKPRLTASRTLDDIYATIAGTLNREEIIRANPSEQKEMVNRALSEQRTLLILDNFESVDDERIASFLWDLPYPTKAIVTTRRALDFGQSLGVGRLSRSEGLNLIARECASKGVRLSADEIARLYSITDGIPLAIVWSVGRMAFGYSVTSTLTLLHKPTADLLRFLFDDALERIRDTSAYHALRSLAVFSTDADRFALRHVADISDDDLEDGLVKLERLSLLTRNGNRYAIHPLTRRFITPRLDEPFLEHTRKRQAAYFLTLGQPRTLYHPYREEEIQEIRANLVNIFDVLNWCHESANWQSVIDLVTLLQDYLALAGYWHERIQWGEKAIKAACQINDEKALGFLYVDTLGWVALTRGEPENAERWVREGLEYARKTDDREVQCMAMRYLSRLARNARDSEVALDWLEQAEKMAAGLSEGFKAGLAIDWALYYDLLEGNLQEAEKWTRKSCDGFRKMNDVVRSARKEVDLARLCLRQERLQEARELLTEPIHLFERLGVRGTEDNLAYAYHCLGEIDTKTGHPDQAYRRLQRASNIYRVIGKDIACKRVSGEIKSLFCKEAEDVYEWLWSETRSQAQVERDPHFINPGEDTRRGTTLIVRPSQECIEKFCHLLERLRAIAPDQYYYDPQDFHVTVLTLVDAHDAFELEKPIEAQYNDVPFGPCPVFHHSSWFSVDSPRV